MRQIITKSIWHETSVLPIKWKDIKHFHFEDDDIIQVAYVEPWENGSDNSGGDHYEVNVTREQVETDDEYNKRLEREQRDAEYLIKRRYQNYLKLKGEFEPDEKTIE